MSYELYHHGVKGQRWGVRRYQNKDGSLTPAGKKQKRVNYAEEAKSMTDEELRSKINRMNLERRYSDLSGGKRSGKGFDTASSITNFGRESVNASKTALKYDTQYQMGKAGNNNELRKSIASDARKMNSTLSIAGTGLDTVSKGISTARKIGDISYKSKKTRIDQKTLSTMSDSDLKKRVERMDLEQRYAGLKNETVSRGRASASEVIGVVGGVVGVGVGVASLALEIYKLTKK